MIRVLLFWVFAVTGQEEFELSGQGGKVSHKLFHSYDGVVWEERGSIQLSVFGDKRRKPLITVKNTKFEKEKLKNTGIYHVGIYTQGEAGYLVQSSIPACYLIGSDLQDYIGVMVDQETGLITAINYKTESKTCEKHTTALKLQTMAEVLNTKEALKPYFALPKHEELQEQQSFFRKYVKSI